MIVKYESAKITHPAPGIVRRIMAHSQNLMLTEHTLEKDAVLPSHNHPHEQMVYVLTGEIILEMNGEQIRMVKGDSLDIPPNTYHKATAVVKSVALDIFSPAREDYI